MAVSPFSLGSRSPFGSISQAAPTLRELYPTEEEYQLAIQQRRLANQANVSEALGISRGEIGQSKGFLSGALDYLTRPQSATLGFLSGLAGRTRAGEESNPLLRAAAALAGRERYTGSQLLGTPSKDAGLAERIARGTLGFGIDVATDPLTYLTFGGGGVLRGAGRAVAAGTAVQKAAPRILNLAPSQAVIPTRTAVGTATEAAKERAKGGIDLITGVRRSPVTAAQRPTSLLTRETPVQAVATAPRVAAPALDTAAPVVAAAPTDDLAKRLGVIAGEQMALGGPRGVLVGLRKELETSGYTKEQARTLANRILAATPSEIRGGIGVSVPFTSKRATISTAAFVEDAPALKAAADFSRKIFNNYRKGPVYQKWANTMNGKVIGPAYAAVIRAAENGSESSLKWEDFLKLNVIDKRSKALAVNLGEENSALLRASQKTIENDKVAKDAFDKYYDMRDRMVLDPAATQSEINGYEAAKNLYDFHQAQYLEATEIAKKLGIELGNLDDYGYMARPFTEEGRQWFRNRGYNPTDDYDPAKVRRAFIELIDGDVRALSNKEINQRVGVKIFEEDGIKLSQHTMAYTVNLLSNLRFLDDLAEANLAKKLEKGSRQFVDVPAFAARRANATTQIDLVIARIAKELADPKLKTSDAKYIKLSKAMEKLATNKDTIDTVLSNIDSSNPADLAKVSDLVNLIKASVKAGDTAGVATGKLRELVDVSGLTRNLTGFEDISALKTQGIVPLVSGELVEKNQVRMPRGFSEYGASEEVRNVVQRLYTLETSKGIKEYSNFVENVYMPYYQLFKTHATITRGPGYHARNLIGGLLNNNLANITVAEHALSAKIDKTLIDATKKAKNALDNVAAGRPSGLPADQDILAQALGDSLRARRVPPTDLEVDQLGKLIGLQELDKIKVGKYTAADILISATDNGVLRGNKTLEALRTDRGAESADALGERLADPKFINVFQSKSRADLNRFQQLLNNSVNNPWVSLQGDIAEHSENFLRMAGFLNGVNKYGLEDGGFAASMIPKATQFDYADLSQVERRVLKNIIPFYTWMRNNVPLQFNALFSQPGKFNRLIYAQNGLATGLGAPGDDDNLSSFVPEYMRAKFGVLTGAEAGGIPTIVGLETPASDLNQLLAFGGPGAQFRQAAPQIVRALNPLFKTSVETLTGRNLTFGTPIEGAGETVQAAARGSIPFLGLGERLFQAGARGAGLPFGKKFFPEEPVRANILRDLLGLPVSGFTPAQQYSEMRRQEERVRGAIKSRVEPGIVDRLLGANPVDKDWLQSMLDAGFSNDQIQRAIALGQGRPRTQG